jgi:hypothetical protein
MPVTLVAWSYVTSLTCYKHLLTSPFRGVSFISIKPLVFVECYLKLFTRQQLAKLGTRPPTQVSNYVRASSFIRQTFNDINNQTSYKLKQN